MLDGSLRETELPVCVGQPRGRAEACMSVFLWLVGAFKSTDQNRGEQRDEYGRATKWSPHVEDVRCPNIASTAEFSPSTKNSVSGILFAPMSFFLVERAERQRWGWGTCNTSPITSLSTLDFLFVWWHPRGKEDGAVRLGAFPPFEACFWVLVQYTHSCP